MNTSLSYRNQQRPTAIPSRIGGFTLIELLVVIAIIALLAAILFPVFGRARENARRSSCQSNLRQIGLGIEQYTQDYDEKYPLKEQFPPSSPDGIGWAEIVQPYLKSTQIFQCPSEPISGGQKGWPNNNPYPLGINYSDYYLNKNLSFADGLSEPARDASKAVLQSSTVTILMGDGFNGGSGYTLEGPQDLNPTDFGQTDSADDLDFATGTWEDSQTLAPRERHLGGANYLFADGHVKFLRPEKVSGGGNQNTSNVADRAVSVNALGAFAATFSLD